MESQQETCITVNEAARRIGSCVRQTDRFIKAGEKEGERESSRSMEYCLFDATIFPNRIRITFGQFSTAVKRVWAAREEERGHEQSEQLPGKFCSLHSVKADAGGGGACDGLENFSS
jgi:hypothetical protein